MQFHFCIPILMKSITINVQLCRKHDVCPKRIISFKSPSIMEPIKSRSSTVPSRGMLQLYFLEERQKSYHFLVQSIVFKLADRGYQKVYERVYLPQMWSIKTDAIKRRLITRTGTGPLKIEKMHLLITMIFKTKQYTSVIVRKSYNAQSSVL